MLPSVAELAKGTRHLAGGR